MEKIEIVGVRDLNFKDDNGRQVEGTQLYYLMDDDRTKGKMAGKLFLSVQRRSTLSYIPGPGEKVMVNYDRYGRPVEFTPIREK